MVRSNESEAKAIRELMLELDSAKGQVPRLPTALWQNVTTAIAAIAVVLVALSYLLGVALLLWLNIDYGISHARLLSVADIGGSVALYIALAVFSLLILLLLIKPIFIWGRAEGEPIALDRRDQADLYEYVHKLCDLLGTPKPERIEVALDANASASLTGFAMGLFSRRPVLTLGLSLIAGTDLQRFTGILAHELAHFKQGRATRFRLIIHAVNMWFARVVYGRDKFDIWVGRASSIAIIGLTLIPVTLILLAGRWILWVFMMIAHAASGLVSRRGEYEADKYMAAVIGSDEIGPTLHRIAVLSLCLDAAMEDMRMSYMTGRLADDLPALASAKANSLSKKREEQVLRLQKLERQTWHSTHPTLLQRMDAAKALNVKPLIKTEGPASLLFEHFDKLCQQLTKDSYEAFFGDELKQIEMVPTEELIEVIHAAERANEALVRFYQCEPPLSRPLLPEAAALEAISDKAAVLDSLTTARSQMLEQMPEYRKLLEALAALQNDIAEVELAHSLLNAGLRPEQIGIHRSVIAAHLRSQLGAMEEEEGRLLDELKPFEARVKQRLSAAVQMLGEDEIARSIGVEHAEERRALMQKLVPLAPLIEEAVPEVRVLAQYADTIVALIQLAGRASDKRRAERSIKRTASELYRGLESLQSMLKDAVYPFDHAHGEVTLSAFVLPSLPENSRDLERLIFVAGDAIERFQTLVAQSMAVSAETAEEVETAAGFVRTDEPETLDPFEMMLDEAQRTGGLRKDAALTERWVYHLAGAAVMCFGILISMVGISSLVPTINTVAVPRHPYYEPTIVPVAIHDPTTGPAFFDPARQWRTANFPGPSDPGFNMPYNYNPNSPYYNPHPGYQPPGGQWNNRDPQSPYYNPTNDPRLPGYDPTQPRPGDPGYVPPNHPNHPNYNPQNPNNSPHLPGYNPNAPSNPNRPQPPGYNNPDDPNNRPNHNRPNHNRPNNQPGSRPQPTRPSPPSPSRPSPPSPSPPRGPSGPF